MTFDVEKAAEEYATSFSDDVDFKPYTPLEVYHGSGYYDVQVIRGKAFLAGHSHALTPRKIDPNDESTYPPEGELVLVFWYGEKLLSVGYWEADGIFREWTHYMSHTAKPPDFWLRYPPTPQREGE